MITKIATYLFIILLFLPGRAPADSPLFTHARLDFHLGNDYKTKIVKTGDLNGDGIDDLLVACRHGPSGKYHILTCRLAGRLLNIDHTLVVDETPLAMAVTSLHLDHDGDADLVVLFEESGACQLNFCLGDGLGGFTCEAPQTCFPLDLSPKHLVVEDFNGDGQNDIVIAGTLAGGGIRIQTFLAAGSGGIPANPPFIIQSRDYMNLALPLCMAPGDFNGDTHPDLALAGRTAQAARRLCLLTWQAGADNFHPKEKVIFTLEDQPHEIVSGFFNKDVHRDIAWTQGSHDLEISCGDGAGGFGTPLTLPTGDNPKHLIPANLLNTDSYPDLAVSNYFGNTLTVISGVSAGQDEPAEAAFSPVAVPGYPSSVAAGRFQPMDRDGLAVVCNNDLLTVLFNNTLAGGGMDTAPAVYCGRRPEIIAVDDLNGDGASDVVLPLFLDHRVAVFTQNPATGHFTEVSDPGLSVPGTKGPVCAVIGSFRGGAAADLAVAYRDSGEVVVFEGHGNAAFGSAARYPLDRRPVAVIGAYLEGGGDTSLDLATANLDGDVSVLLNAGGVFGPARHVPAADETAPGIQPVEDEPVILESLAAGDFDGDGGADIAAVDFYHSELIFLRNDGTGNFARITACPVGKGPVWVEYADLIISGPIPDRRLFTANRMSHTVTSVIVGSDWTCTGQTIDVGRNPSFVRAHDLLTGDNRRELIVLNGMDNNLSLLRFGLSPGAFERIELNMDYGTELRPVSLGVGTRTSGSGPVQWLAVANEGSGNFSYFTFSESP